MADQETRVERDDPAPNGESRDPLALLGEFGLTRQEATVYLSIVAEGPMNGYEIAKAIGISRSNAYTALASLVDKGAAWIVEGSPTRYTPVPVDEFTDNRLHRLKGCRERLLASVPSRKERPGNYVTIRGRDQILDRLRHLILDAEERLYLSLDSGLVRRYREELVAVSGAGKKLVVVTAKAALADGELAKALPGAELHGTEREPAQVRAIADSRYALTGDVPEREDASCLFSDERNLVELFKSALRNEIILADLGSRDAPAR